MKLHQILTVAMLLVLARPLQSNAIPLIGSPGTGDLFSGDSVTLGNVFTVGTKPLTVTALGLFDSGTPGFSQSHSVGLWTTSGTLLARADFLPGLNGFTDNGFQYLGLASPLILLAGTSYILGASYPSGTTDLCYANDTIQYESWGATVTYINSRYTASGAGFTFPRYTVGGLSYVGANLEYTVPDQPDTFVLLLGSGLVCGLVSSLKGGKLVGGRLHRAS
jgi:hypothetical protein